MARLERASLGALRFRCDGCEAIVEVARLPERWASDDRAVEQAAGWKAVWVDGAWEHYCPECTKSRDIDLSG